MPQPASAPVVVSSVEGSFPWAESFFYRKLLAALGYFSPGAWQGIDRFSVTGYRRWHPR
ncbi:hypothetical protein ACGFSB_21625 [Streptomyces sp. NPDC048441]|uniref:hypothetical protein n=1 Tax=Streptomyces sp. NPDC048441 TaxID=3365552 RepID=UPI00371B7C01